MLSVMPWAAMPVKIHATSTEVYDMVRVLQTPSRPVGALFRSRDAAAVSLGPLEDLAVSFPVDDNALDRPTTLAVCEHALPPASRACLVCPDCRAAACVVCLARDSIEATAPLDIVGAMGRLSLSRPRLIPSRFACRLCAREEPWADAVRRAR
jgi:hypothetical protein